MASPGAVGKTYAAAIDKAAQYLPTQLSTSLSSRRRSQSAGLPPVLVSVRRQLGEDVYIPVNLDTSLQQLRDVCERESGVPSPAQRLFVEEETSTSGGGIVSALRSTASQLTSRERVRETLVDWVNFIFLPEAVNREVRGRGLMSWAKEHVLPRLQGPPPPNIATATVMLIGGRRGWVELSSTATLHRLREVVERQTGLPSERQRIVIAEEAPQGVFVQLFWAVARVGYVVAGAAVGVAVAWARWLVLGPEADQTIKLKLQTLDGRAVSMAVRQDVTLGQLQHMVQLQHGDSVNLQGLVLAGAPRGEAPGGVE